MKTLLCFIILTTSTWALGAENPPFSFHLKTEPHDLHPKKATSGTQNYLLNNLYRGLIRVDENETVIFEQAKKCRFQGPQQVYCNLRKLKWSDGKPVTSQDYKQSFLSYLEKDSQCPCLDLLFSIKNAKNFYLGKAKADAVGISTPSDQELVFDLEEPDRDFLERLSNPLMVPHREPLKKGDWTTLPVNGPYKIKSWAPKKEILLTANPEFEGGNKSRPDVKIIFVNEDSAALALYEKGMINFLWRLPTEFISKYEGRKTEFHQIPVMRFDYIGFNLRPGSPFEKKEVREAFLKSIDFEEFKKVFSALGRPGCTGLGDLILEDEERLCVTPDPAKVKSIKESKVLPKKVEILFSQLGGDDHRRAMQWFQEQWHKNLDVKVELKSMEQKSFLQKLSNSPPPLFRKGLGLDRPTCLAAIEIFAKDHPENFVGYKPSKEFDLLLKGLKQQKLSRAEQSSVCAAAIRTLFKDDLVGIPMGRIHFTMLARPEFEGWHVNALNQLDLSELKYVGASK